MIDYAPQHPLILCSLQFEAKLLSFPSTVTLSQYQQQLTVEYLVRKFRDWTILELTELLRTTYSFTNACHFFSYTVSPCEEFK